MALDGLHVVNEEMFAARTRALLKDVMPDDVRPADLEKAVGIALDIMRVKIPFGTYVAYGEFVQIIGDLTEVDDAILDEDAVDEWLALLAWEPAFV